MVTPSVHAVPSRRFGNNYKSFRERIQSNSKEMELPILLEQRLRQQLARELHDGPVQLVSNAAMNLMTVQKQLEREPQRAQAEIASTVATLQRAIQEMRAMLFELRPMVLETEGLISAIHELAVHLRETTSLKVDLDLQVSRLDLTPGDETNIYYIVQEAIQNIHKHARAKQVQIRFQCFEGALHISIRDDGTGFDLERIRSEYEKRKSLGLINLYERAQLIRGHLTIDALQGRGTTIRLTVPLAQPVA
jgi:signal transduction histidine kinase